MKILNYFFWKITRYRLEKDGFDSTYIKAILIFGLFILVIPIIITQSDSLVFEHIRKLSKPLQYLCFFPLIVLTAIPFWVMFPKEKIRNLNYSDEEKKKYNRKILYVFLFFIFLLISRIIYVKFYKY